MTYYGNILNALVAVITFRSATAKKKKNNKERTPAPTLRRLRFNVRRLRPRIRRRFDHLINILDERDKVDGAFY